MVNITPAKHQHVSIVIRGMLVALRGCSLVKKSFVQLSPGVLQICWKPELALLPRLMKEHKMQFSCYCKAKGLFYSCSFISSLPLKGKKEVLWIHQQLWASNVHAENGMLTPMLTLVANGTVTTWSVSRIRRPPLAVMLAMSTPLGQTTHRTNSSYHCLLIYLIMTTSDGGAWLPVVAKNDFSII